MYIRIKSTCDSCMTPASCSQWSVDMLLFHRLFVRWASKWSSSVARKVRRGSVISYPEKFRCVHLCMMCCVWACMTLMLAYVICSTFQDLLFQDMLRYFVIIHFSKASHFLLLIKWYTIFCTTYVIMYYNVRYLYVPTGAIRSEIWWLLNESH